MSKRVKKLAVFLEETIEYFLKKVDGIDRDRYFADRDIRYILDKCINDWLNTETNWYINI